MGYEGLQKQSIDVRLGGGLAQSEHDFITDAPGLLKAENVRFDKKGALGKRFGNTTTTLSNPPSTTSLGESNACFEHRDQFVVVGPAGCHRADADETTWRETNVRAPRVSRLLTDSIVRSNSDTANGYADVVGDLLCVAWDGFAPEEHANVGEPVCFYQFFKADTLSPLCQPRILESAGTGFVPMAVLGLDDTFVIISSHATTGRFATYAVSAGTYTFGTHSALPGPTPTSTGRIAKGGSDDFLVAVNILGTTHFSAFDSAGSSLGTDTEAAFVSADVAWNPVLSRYISLAVDGTVRHVDATATVTASTGGVTPPTSVDARIALRTSSGAMLMAFCGDEGTWLALVSSALAETSSGVVAHLGAGGAYPPELLYLGDLGIEDTLITWVDRVEGFGFVPTEDTATGSVSPYGALPQPYMISARPTLYTGAEGSTLGVAEVGRCLMDRSESVRSVFVYDGKAHVLARTAVDVVGWTDTNVARYGYDLARLQLENAPPRPGVQAASLRLLPGGSGVVCYDGVSLTELTPPRPQHIANGGNISDPTYDADTWGDETNVPGATAGTGDPDTGGYYARVRVLYRYVDAVGNVHRGAPSGVLRWSVLDTTAVPSGTNYPVRVIKFPRVGITTINGDIGGQLQVEVYQAASPDGETWHLVGVCTPRIHPTDLDYWYLTPAWGRSTLLEYQFNLQYTDALAAMPQGYFDSEADNVPPPPLLHMCSTQARVWGISAEDRNRVVYTKEIVSGRAPEFGDGFALQVPDEGGSEEPGEGGCTAIAAIDDGVIIFKRGRIYRVFGDPGDAAGSGSSLQVPRLISSDVGCIDASSVVEGPFGVAFLSLKGFYLLGRDLSLTFVGEPVQREVGDLTCTTGTLVPRHSEVRWLFDDSVGAGTTPVALVWNYKSNAWSRWTAYSGRSATIYRDEYTRLHSLYSTITETTDAWSGATHEVIVRTPWLKLAGLQGFKRIWRAAFLGRWWTGDVAISCEYDYRTIGDGDTLDTQTWTAATLATLLEPSQYEEGGETSTGAYRLQIVRKPTLQKVEAIRFTVTENNDGGQQGGTSGRGFELVGMQLDLGLKRGGYKPLPSGAKK